MGVLGECCLKNGESQKKCILQKYSAYVILVTDKER
jgi:hypothetical protein